MQCSAALREIGGTGKTIIGERQDGVFVLERTKFQSTDPFIREFAFSLRPALNSLEQLDAERI
jgi:hypothetical protein